MKINIKNKGAFTLVELIVVIVILSILGTIGFLSYSSFQVGARDVMRVSNVKVVSDGLEISKVKGGGIPNPENYVTVTASGEIIGYEGDLGDKVLSSAGVSKGANIDPLDDSFYTLFVSKNNYRYQILYQLESEENFALNTNITNSTFADGNGRIPQVKGDSLGILLDENNIPIHKVEAVKAIGTFDMLGDDFRDMIIQPFFTNSTVKEKAIKWGGQLLQTANTQKFQEPDECPEGFIPVPGNEELGQPGFCAGKYEASIEGDPDCTGASVVIDSGVYKTCKIGGAIKIFTSKEGGIPVSYFDDNDNDEQIMGCERLGSGYHTMTVNERIAISRNIENNSLNWSNGVTGSGHIKTGNSGNTTTGFNNSGLVLRGGTDGDPTHDELRTLTLSNGEKIWDFIGNAWEVVAQTNIAGDNSGKIRNSLDIRNSLSESFGTSSYVELSETNNENYLKHFGPQIGSGSIQGMGVYREVIGGANFPNNIYIMGGDTDTGTSLNENGLYSNITLYMYHYQNISTRCSYSGKF